MSWEADVFQGNRLVARIERTATGSRMEFDSDLLADPPAYPGRLSWLIPYQEESLVQTGDNLHPFFTNLLPEGARLDALLSGGRIAKDDFLGLLLKVGWDTVGDIAVVPHDESPSTRTPIEKKDPEEMEFATLLTDVSPTQSFDAAISGVQDKLSSAMFSLPVATRSWPAAILKLNPRNFPLLVQNEEFFLRMARDCGVPVNDSRLVKDRVGEAGLLVKRFDRRKVSRAAPTKLHQEDGCQLLGQAPANKYHVSLQEIAAVFQQACTAPIVEIRSLIRLYAFSYVIGNSDLHAKNVSLLWDEKAIVMSPAYDLPSGLPYRRLDPRMAISMLGKNDHFKANHFVEFGARYNVGERAILQDLRKLIERSEAWLDELGSIGYSDQETEHVRAEIANRRERIRP